MIKIILADDHHLVRSGFKSLLEMDPDFEIIGEAVNGAEVLNLLRTGRLADVVLADLHMPIMGGIDLIKVLATDFPDCKSIILSAADEIKDVLNVFRAGACGYLLKSISTEELVFAVKHTHKYSEYICSQLSRKFLNSLLDMPVPASHVDLQNLKFTAKDIEILNLIAAGYTNQEIADRLFSSKRTIENHRQILIDKTGSRNTVSLIYYAVANGIIN